MPSKYKHTIILMQHSRAWFRRWEVSTGRLIAAALGLALLLSLSVFATWSHLTRNVSRHDVEALAAENQRLRAANQEFEASLRSLKDQLTDFEERTSQLAIVAGLEGSVIEQQSGVGGTEILGSDSEGSRVSSDFVQRLERLESQLGGVEAVLSEQTQRIAATPAISPVQGVLTSGFGVRTDPLTGKRAMHRAIDLSTAPGMPVVATADGIVVKAERSGRLGNAIYLAHGFGISTRYAHMARFSVKPGQRIRRGEVIGYVGNTGRTTGYHLHYEVRVDGQPVNPLAYILDRPATRS